MPFSSLQVSLLQWQVYRRSRLAKEANRCVRDLSGSSTAGAPLESEHATVAQT